MTRAHGCCALGEHLVAKVPHRQWNTLTFVGALLCDGITAPCLLNGPINAISLLACVTQFLVPTLQHGDVVAIDNLGSHKSRAVHRTIGAAGAHVVFLPSYSPDLGPIEQILAKVKAPLRKADPRSIEQAWKTIGTLLREVTAQECNNYLRNSGYSSI